jgi:hypothetical protein
MSVAFAARARRAGCALALLLGRRRSRCGGRSRSGRRRRLHVGFWMGRRHGPRRADDLRNGLQFHKGLVASIQRRFAMALKIVGGMLQFRLYLLQRPDRALIYKRARSSGASRRPVHLPGRGHGGCWRSGGRRGSRCSGDVSLRAQIVQGEGQRASASQTGKHHCFSFHVLSLLLGNTGERLPCRAKIVKSKFAARLQFVFEFLRTPL